MTGSSANPRRRLVHALLRLSLAVAVLAFASLRASAEYWEGGGGFCAPNDVVKAEYVGIHLDPEPNCVAPDAEWWCQNIDGGDYINNNGDVEDEGVMKPLCSCCAYPLPGGGD